VPDSKYIWMAFLGPDTRPLGERKGIGHTVSEPASAAQILMCSCSIVTAPGAENAKPFETGIERAAASIDP
jgi:hypothetical protein